MGPTVDGRTVGTRIVVLAVYTARRSGIRIDLRRKMTKIVREFLEVSLWIKLGLRDISSKNPIQN